MNSISVFSQTEVVNDVISRLVAEDVRLNNLVKFGILSYFQSHYGIIWLLAGGRRGSKVW